MTFDPSTYKYEFFTVSEIQEGFAHVQYTNPKTLNAFSEQNWKDYGSIFARLDAEEDIQVILFSSGVPRSFSSGLNLKTAANLFSSEQQSTAEAIKDLHVHIRDFQSDIGTPARISTPTIAILNGLNLGLALDMAAAYTIRIAVEGAQFSIAEVNIGITADIGSLQRLPALINNKSLLFQHALLGDKWGPEEAEKLGFVSTVVPSVEAGIEYAKALGAKICEAPAWAIKGTKKHIQDVINGTSVDQGLADVANWNARNITLSKGKL
ncbi:Delta(3,5)-Delta(2,4)-dienoyl-CoA isomerase, mitochondrial [Candida viswanathii]|uniref:Delta(3,5)-Delta(2,4)-dienoyl-CoA isomerase, mitochondrial n=1 Tax=Candida viswanathii TaxID=5486 RepID=A0A367YGN1_9ASCO|nr:Delta(3,5)-Delta(2,4)-dienoyl-CoA isomerase, mitochondrial [Candida viswanathii]